MTMHAVYIEEPSGVLFSFLLDGDKTLGWVSKNSLESYTKEELTPEECVGVYHAHKTIIQKAVLSNATGWEAQNQ